MNHMINLEGNVVMTSLNFLNAIINPARELEGENSLRNTELIRKIESECDDLGGLHTFCNPSGTDQKFYWLTMDQMMLVGMRESKAVRKSVLAKLKEIEQPSLPDFNDPIAAARAWADAKEQALIAEKQLAIAAPKAEFVDKFVDSSGLFGFRQVAKTLGVKENWLREFLQEQKIMYYLKGKLTAYANHIDAGRFQSRVGVADNGHNFNECKFTAKGVEWIAALVAVEKIKAQ
ncbi:MAG: phage antirepressor KilAC domain-containing protein [Aeromonas veronii]